MTILLLSSSKQLSFLAIFVLVLQTIFLQTSALKTNSFCFKRIHPLFLQSSSKYIRSHTVPIEFICTHRVVSTALQSNSDADMNWNPRAAPKLDFNEDFYSVLEVKPDASAQDLKKSYYRLVFDYHPDRKKTEEEKSLCNKQMMVINNAYKVLKEPKTRSEYDMQRRLRQGSSSSGPFSRSGGSSTSASGGSSSGAVKTSDNATKRPSSSSGDKESAFSSFNQGAFNWREKSSVSDVFNSIFDDEDEIFSEAEEYFRDPRDDPSFRDQFKSTTGRPMDLHARINAVRREKEAKEEALVSDRRDWGEVTDARAIQKRLRDLEEVRRLDELLIELQAEIDYQQWASKQGRIPGGSSSSSGSRSAGSRGDSVGRGSQPRTSSLWDELIGVAAEDGSGDPFRETFRDGRSSGKEYDEDGVPLWRKRQAEQRRARGSEAATPPPVSGADVDEAFREELERLLGINKKKKN